MLEEYTNNGLDIKFNTPEYMVTPGFKVQTLEVTDRQEVKGTRKFKCSEFLLMKHKATKEWIALNQTRACIRQLNSTLWDSHITRHTKQLYLIP